MRLIHTPKVQDKPHPNTHLSLYPHLFLVFFVAVCPFNDLKDPLSRNGYPRGVITYNERCCEQKPKQASRSHHYGTQKRCFRRLALSWSSEIIPHKAA